MQDSSHSYTNTNTIARILKHAFHFSVKRCIICYCVWPDGDDEKCKKLKSSKGIQNHSVCQKCIMLLKFCHTPPPQKKRKKREKKEFINVYWLLLNRKVKDQWKVCVLMVWKGTDIAHSVKEAILESQKMYYFIPFKLFRI